MGEPALCEAWKSFYKPLLHSISLRNYSLTVSAVGGGGAAYSFFKYSGIIIAGMKADGLGNLLDIVIPLEKKLFGFLYSKAENVVYNSGARVLFKYGIAVNAICPGYFYSPLTRETLDSEFFQANAKTMIPMERYGDEGELDTAAIFLASPATTYVTGVMLPVDGGYTCM
jgi:hypothetical protein